MKKLVALILSWVCLVTGIAAQAEALPTPAVKLLRSISNPLFFKEPAQIFYTRPSGEESSYLLNAALQSKGFALDALSSRDVLSTEFRAGAEIAKNTVKDNRSDRRLLAASLASQWTLGERKSLLLDFTAARYEDRLNDSKGNDFLLSAILNVPLLDSSSYRDIISSGASIKIYPVAGVYRRHITSTDNPLTAPRGHIGGPYLGVNALLGVGQVIDDSWVNKLNLEMGYMRLHDASVSGGYSKGYYNFLDASLRYAFYDKGNRWKPSIAITRTVGTDRLSGKQYMAETSVGFLLSYGL